MSPRLKIIDFNGTEETEKRTSHIFDFLVESKWHYVPHTSFIAVSILLNTRAIKRRVYGNYPIMNRFHGKSFGFSRFSSRSIYFLDHVDRGRVELLSNAET